ncbi:MAG: hypothetical protein SFV54_01385 [Bryobacteraceae bacterium]|nr:hypothetical protein [Bryobacteraceae bacterium]
MRIVLYLFAAIIILTLVRFFAGMLARAANEVLSGPTTPKRRETKVPEGGELKKDPVCGTYVAASTTFTKKLGGEVFYFCSEECRKTYRG